MKKIIQKYLPDMLILFGIWFFAYNVYFPIMETLLDLDPDEFSFRYNYSEEFKFLSIVLISIGVDIGLRRYFKK